MREFLYGYADPEMVRVALGRLERSGDQLHHDLHMYIEAIDLQARGTHFLLRPRTPVEALDEVFAYIAQKDKARGNFRKWAGGVSSFFLIMLRELRTIICGRGKTPRKLGTQSQALLTAVAAAIARKVGLDGPSAIGLAVLMLIALGQATKNTFCQMTDPEVLKALMG